MSMSSVKVGNFTSLIKAGFVLLVVGLLSRCAPSPEGELKVIALESESTVSEEGGSAVFDTHIKAGQFVIAKDEFGEVKYYSFVLRPVEGVQIPEDIAVEIFSTDNEVPLNAKTTALALVFLNPTMSLLTPESKVKLIPYIIKHELWDELVREVEDGYPAQNPRAGSLALKIAWDVWRDFTRTRRLNFKSVTTYDVKMEKQNKIARVENDTPIPYVIAVCEGDWGKRAGELIQRNEFPNVPCQIWYLPGKLVDIKIESREIRAELVDPEGFSVIRIPVQKNKTVLIIRSIELAEASKEALQQVEGQAPVSDKFIHDKLPIAKWLVQGAQILAGAIQGQDVSTQLRAFATEVAVYAGATLLNAIGVPTVIGAPIVDGVLALITGGELGGATPVGRFVIDEILDKEWQIEKMFRDLARGELVRVGKKFLNAADAWVKAFKEGEKQGWTLDQTMKRALAQYEAMIKQYKSNAQEFSKYVDMLKSNPTAQSILNSPSTIIDLLAQVWPNIKKIVPTDIKPGSIVDIYGEDFGEKKGEVTIAGVKIPILRWTNTHIRIRIPEELFEKLGIRLSPSLKPASVVRYIEIKTADGMTASFPVTFSGGANYGDPGAVTGGGGQGGGCASTHASLLIIYLVGIALLARMLKRK